MSCQVVNFVRLARILKLQRAYKKQGEFLKILEKKKCPVYAVKYDNCFNISKFICSSFVLATAKNITFERAKTKPYQAKCVCWQ